MINFKRKIYKRGSSFETTIPKPLLFGLDPDKKHHLIFKMDPESKKWFVEIVPDHSEVKPKEKPDLKPRRKDYIS